MKKYSHPEKPRQEKHQSGKQKRQVQKSAHRGVIRTTGKGMGFVAVPELPEEILIQPEFMNTALPGDKVEIILQPKNVTMRSNRSRDLLQTGQVVRIIERVKKDYVGVLVEDKGQYRVVADDRRMYVDIAIPKDKLNKAQVGEKVFAHVEKWEKFQSIPQGRILKVIGRKGEHETEIQSIILDRGIDTRFPHEVEQEAKNIEHTEKPLRAEEIAQRKDFRNTLTFTIDPVDAKDFDDALSIKKLGDTQYEIGVHIADVSYYVREGTSLDHEAKKRATSIYLVDRTIPMLPEVLSNDLCSLNPNEEKFAFSAVFVMDMEGTVHERWFGKSVIRSDKRFSYESAQESLSKHGEYFEELDTLNKIANKLRYEKYLQGAIDFETEEVKFKLDPNGKPLEVIKKDRLDTHKLIEEFMLLANKEVAEFIWNAQKNNAERASLYRIHDVPDSERIEDLAMFLQALGYHLPSKRGKISSQDINTLLKSIVGKPEESLIKTATIRSMAKAIYSTKNIGHFGLAFEFYTHFTSPIRRYPDLVVHRILENILNGHLKKVKDEWRVLDTIAAHSTDKEIDAAEAERASIKYKQVEYMSDHVGENFDGMISGVTEWGIFVEDLKTKCEGLVPLRELGGDYFVFNKKTYSVKGEKTKREYRLGDKVRFKVVKADLDNKTLDYKLVE
jgi:ribonuclease R